MCIHSFWQSIHAWIKSVFNTTSPGYIIWRTGNKHKNTFTLHQNIFAYWGLSLTMGLLPDKQYCGCACAGNAGNAFPVTAGKRSRHASRHVRHARAVMHAGIANLRFPLKSAAGENVPGIPGACACNLQFYVSGKRPMPEKVEYMITHEINLTKKVQ